MRGQRLGLWSESRDIGDREKGKRKVNKDKDRNRNGVRDGDRIENRGRKKESITCPGFWKR